MTSYIIRDFILLLLLLLLLLFILLFDVSESGVIKYYVKDMHSIFHCKQRLYFYLRINSVVS
jgi:hypothetical protein